MKPNVLPGHALLAEGAALDERGARKSWNHVSGAGRGMCSCGAMSEELPSSTQRRAWHREHKDSVRAQQDSAS